METAGSVKWTADDIKELLEIMELNLTNRERSKIWSTGMKTFDWDMVSFKSFTARECRLKWNGIMQKLRKIKNLAELITDAQNAIDMFADTTIQRPKMPVPANALYFGDNRNQIKMMNPGMRSRDLMKFANDKYRALPLEEKKKYLQRAENLKEQYRLSQKKISSHSHHLKKQQRLDKKADLKKSINSIKKEQKPPPKNLNGYHLFCKDQKSTLTGIRQGEVLKVLAKKWKTLPKEERVKYGQRCREFKRAHRKPKTKLLPGEPKMPTRCVLVVHRLNKFKEMRGKTNKYREIFAYVKEQSKNISNQEREECQAQIEGHFKTYEESLQKWFKTLTPLKQIEYCKTKPTKLKYLQCKPLISHHRTSDSEDEDLDDSASDDDVTYVVTDSVEEKHEAMFDLF